MKAKIYTRAAGAMLVIAAAACNQDLAVENLSNPDIARVFATENSIESTIAAGYQTTHNTLSNQGNQPAVEMFGLEGFSQLNNFSMGTRVAVPRLPVSNQSGDLPAINGEFSGLSKEARLVVNAMDALDKLVKGGTASNPAAQNARNRSFGFFVAGADLGWMAIIYDSAGIVGPGMRADSIPPLSGSAAVGAAALTLLDSALAIANNPANAAGWPIAATWFSQAGTTTLDQYKRIVRSYRARIRAYVARTPAQAAAVDWAKVIDDAENGINADFFVNSGGSTGWGIGNMSQKYVDPGWMQSPMTYFGMADVSGGYAAYAAAPSFGAKNGNFEVVTPDKRWPQAAGTACATPSAGACRTAQVAASTVAVGNANVKPYFINRDPKLDVAGDAWGTSHYDYNRYRYIRAAANQGLYPEIMKAEIDLLAAEGYIRTGNIAAAAAKIDLTRVANGGLPALTGVITTATQAVPGGASCVPQVPTAGGTVACGTIMEALKYEKRMETAYSSWGRFWIDERVWGDLVTGTPLEFPVPWQEMDARREHSYNAGGGFASSAPKGTYGF